MHTFVKCASVFRISMTHWSKKKRKFWMAHALEQHEKLRIIELDGGVLID